MKNFKLVLFVALASLFVACDDAIDITQPSELTPEAAYETVEDLQLGLNGVYSSIPGESQILFTSLFTDEVKIGRANGGQGTGGELGFLLNTNSGDAASIWVSNYSLINSANRLIFGAAKVVPTTEEEIEEYNSILGQAYALRAFGHLQLLSYFTTNMADDSALGVPLVDFVPTTDQQLSRNTNGEVFALIESDLKFAEDNIANSLVGGLYVANTGVTTNVVNAIRARMYVYREKYDVAEPYVNALSSIALATKGPINATNRGTYVNMFLDQGVGEVIWKLQRTTTGGGTGNFYQFWSSVNSTVNGSPFYEVSTALFNLVNNSTDIRRDVIVDPSAAPSYTVRPVGKYSITENINLLADVKVFRASEIRFLKAEILASRNDLAGVATQVNSVRRARNNLTLTGNVGILPAPTTVKEAWAMILQERRVELAFEGHRYIDLRRLGAKADVSVNRSASDCAFNEACELPIDDYRWTLPIPRSEQAANPGIQQNPGY